MVGNSAGRAFVGSFTSAGGLGITAAAVDRDTGALTVLGSTDAVPDPSFLAIGARDGETVLYAVSESAPGVAAAFSADGDVPPCWAPSRPSAATGPPIWRLPRTTWSRPTTPPAASPRCPSSTTGRSGPPPTSCGTRAAARTPTGRRARTPTRCSPTLPGPG
ncbi:hypothetical protein SCYAM73S_02855 [Streptomyces cyaneofuscatus]